VYDEAYRGRKNPLRKRKKPGETPLINKCKDTEEKMLSYAYHSITPYENADSKGPGTPT